MIIYSRHNNNDMIDKIDKLSKLNSKLDQLNMVYMWVKQQHITRSEFVQLIDWMGMGRQTQPTPHKRFTDEWGNSDWRDTGEMGG